MLYLKTNKVATWFTMLFLLLGSLTKSQELYFKSLALFNEDPDLTINAMIVDEDGLIWLASDESLIESDGANTFYYPIEKSENSEKISALFYHNGLMYIGWNDGYLSIYSTLLKKTISNVKYVESAIQSIVIDKNKTIWLGSSENGILILDQGKTVKLDINFGLIDNIVNDLVYSKKDSSVYVATDRGISRCYFRGKNVQIENFSSSEGLSDNFITSLHIDKQKRLWVGSYSGRVFRMDEGYHFEELQTNGGKASAITSIVSNDLNTWIFSVENGIIKVDEKDRVSSVNANAKLSNILFGEIVQGDKLLLLQNKNTILLADTRLEFYMGSKNPIYSNLSLVYSVDDGLYFANEKRIYYKENDSLSLILDLEKEKIQYVISAYKDSEGTVWFGTFDQGIIRLKNGIFDRFTEIDGLINNNVMTIHEWDGKIWFGTLGGLSSLKSSDTDNEFNSYSKKEGLEASYIYQLYSHDDVLYIATEGNGIIKYDGNTFKEIAMNEIESVYDITSYNEKVFTSAKNGKIIQMTGEVKVKEYQIKYNGKPIGIESLSLLEKDHLIFDWELGFGVININTSGFQLFESSYGLKDYQNDFLKVLSSGQDGNAMLGSSDYLVSFSLPLGLGLNESKSIIRNVELFSVPVDTTKHIYSHDENLFTFSILSNCLQDPAHISFQYRLKGLNDNWISTKDQSITFQNLDAGEYVFELRSGPSYSIENANINSYSFRIKKAFYTTWWFFTLLLLMVAFTVYSFTVYKNKKSLMERKLAYERVLSQFELLKSQINPHFLFNSLNTAYALIDVNNKEARDYLLNLSKYLRAILTKNQEHVISLKKELNFAENYTILQKKRFGENVIFKLEDLDDFILDSYIPPLSLQILIENAIKHNVISKTHPLIIRIFEKEGYLIIENNRKEKIEHAEGTKIGLSNIQSRYRLLFDKDIIIEKTDAIFVVKLPIITDYVKNIAN